MNLLSCLAAAAALFGSLSSAAAGIVSADFRAVLSLPVGVSEDKANVFENLGATVSASAEELNYTNLVQHDYTGGVGVDLQPGSNTLSLFVTETFEEGAADFERIVVTLTNIVTDDGMPITGFALEFDDLMDLAISGPYALTTSFTDDSLTVVFATGSDLPFNIRNGGTALFTFTTGEAAPTPVSSPATIALLGAGLLGLGLLGMGLFRRRKAD